MAPLLVVVGGGDNYNCCHDHSLLMNLIEVIQLKRLSFLLIDSVAED